jgi:hypothetical protein
MIGILVKVVWTVTVNIKPGILVKSGWSLHPGSSRASVGEITAKVTSRTIMERIDFLVCVPGHRISLRQPLPQIRKTQGHIILMQNVSWQTPFWFNFSVFLFSRLWYFCFRILIYFYKIFDDTEAFQRSRRNILFPPAPIHFGYARWDYKREHCISMLKV